MKQNLLLILFVLGLFLPTSISGTITPNLPIIYAALAVPVYLLLVIWYGNGRVSKARGIIAVLISFVLWGATLLTPFSSYAFGNSVYFILFSLMICLNLKEEKVSSKKINLVNAIHLVNLMLCLFITIQNQTIISFFINNYSLYYPEMMEYALIMKKPVIMFAAHSIAGLYLFIFFFVSFALYKTNKKVLNLAISIAYLYFIFHLNSNGGYVFFFIGIAITLAYFVKEKPFKTLMSSIAGFLGLSGLLILNPTILTNAYMKYSTLMTTTLSSQNNGIIGRYFGQGILNENIEYMKENPFRPVGFGYNTELFFGDSGLSEYMLRGSLALVILMYLGIYLFLCRNLASKRAAVLLFIAFFIMDTGAPLLISFRLLFMLPFTVILLNKILDKEITLNNKQLIVNKAA